MKQLVNNYVIFMDFVMLVVFIICDSFYQSKYKLTSCSNFVFIMFDVFF